MWIQPCESALPAHTSPPAGASHPLPDPNLWVITEHRAELPVLQACTQLRPMLWNPMDYRLPGSFDLGFELSFPSPGDLPYSGIEPMSPESAALAGRFFTRPPGKLHASHYLSVYPSSYPPSFLSPQLPTALHMVVYICQHHSFHLSHPLLHLCFC